MKPRTAKETAVMCAACVLAVPLLTIPFELAPVGPHGAVISNTKGLAWIVIAGVIALGMVLGYRYLSIRKRAQIELAGGEQHHRLAEEIPSAGRPGHHRPGAAHDVVGPAWPSAAAVCSPRPADRTMLTA